MYKGVSMRQLIVRWLVTVTILWCVSPIAASAQRRQPHESSIAIGFEAGSFISDADALENALLLGALFEYYATPRVSFRGAFNWTAPGFEREPEDSVRQLQLRLDVSYNWEHGRWHPFVAAGVGDYIMQHRDNGRAIGDSNVKVGLNLGAGIEYFLDRDMTFKTEGRYHAVDAPRRWPDPSGWALTAGMKKYF